MDKSAVCWCVLVAVVITQVMEGEGRRGVGDGKLPNVIIFFVDDLAWGDLSAYGHPTSYTPNIQRMADQGLLFTQFYTSSPVCSPSRAAILTGRYQMRSGIYPKVFDPDDLGGLPLNETTIAEGLKEVGYSTGMVGKWHLGYGRNGSLLPNHQGFDYYRGIPYTHDACPCYHCFYPTQPCFTECHPQYVPCPLFECHGDYQKILQQPADLTTLTANVMTGAVSFITTQAANGKPFFLYYAFQHLHSPQFAGHIFRNSSVRGPFGDSLSEVDWAVGQVFGALRSSGVHNDTLVFLTADNGPDLNQGYRGGSAGPLRCGKASTWEGGMRAPAIAWWPGRVRHARTHQLASSLDLLPTIFTLAGAKLPQDRRIDGVDMSDILFDQYGQSKREFFAYFPEDAAESLGPFAIRWRQYKAHYYTRGGAAPDDYPDPLCRGNETLKEHYPPILYNLEQDPGEVWPLDTMQYYRVLQQMDKVREEFRADLEWAEPQPLVGKDAYVQACGDPGCQPFPYCCQVDLLADTDALHHTPL